uniref:Uncharacterized protein n=1 Tax=Manihot esculenta TaxID=3983 RepID=A0A2C9V7K8_MANES
MVSILNGLCIGKGKCVFAHEKQLLNFHFLKKNSNFHFSCKIREHGK